MFHQGFPVTASAPKNTILLGAKGASSSSAITSLAKAAVDQDLLGIMVWYCSVQEGLLYEASWDCSGSQDSANAYVEALKYLNENS